MDQITRIEELATWQNELMARLLIMLDSLDIYSSSNKLKYPDLELKVFKGASDPLKTSEDEISNQDTSVYC